jgi:hypothetical protein
MARLGRLLREWPTVVAAVVTALFGANDTLQILFSGDVSRFGFFLAFVFFAGWVVIRLGQLQAKLDEKDRYRRAIARIDPLITEAQEILESCGRPREQMLGSDPMYFQNVCMPRINKFALNATTTIREVAPEYVGKFQNVGNVTYGTDVKPAMIQQMERWLDNLGAIQDELRKHL